MFQGGRPHLLVLKQAERILVLVLTLLAARLLLAPLAEVLAVLLRLVHLAEVLVIRPRRQRLHKLEKGSLAQMLHC